MVGGGVSISQEGGVGVWVGCRDVGGCGFREVGERGCVCDVTTPTPAPNVTHVTSRNMKTVSRWSSRLRSLHPSRGSWIPIVQSWDFKRPGSASCLMVRELPPRIRPRSLGGRGDYPDDSRSSMRQIFFSASNSMPSIVASTSSGPCAANP